MIFHPSRTRKITVAKKPKDRLLPHSLRGTYRRLQQVNNALLTNHYWEQRSYIAAIAMQYALKAIPARPEEKIRVHFLHVDANLWPLWDSLYRACMEDARLEVKIIFLDTTGSPLVEEFPQNAAFLRENGIPHTPYADYDPYAERPHMLLYQSPCDALYLHFARCKANFIRKHGIRPVCFCGPEYDAPDAPETRKALYQQYVQMFAWKIVAPRREIKEAFYRRCLPGGDAVLVVDDMSGEGIRDGLLDALHEERERLAQTGNSATVSDGLEALARGMPGER